MRRKRIVAAIRCTAVVTEHHRNRRYAIRVRCQRISQRAGGRVDRRLNAEQRVVVIGHRKGQHLRALAGVALADRSRPPGHALRRRILVNGLVSPFHKARLVVYAVDRDGKGLRRRVVAAIGRTTVIRENHRNGRATRCTGRRRVGKRARCRVDRRLNAEKCVVGVGQCKRKNL